MLFCLSSNEAFSALKSDVNNKGLLGESSPFKLAVNFNSPLELYLFNIAKSLIGKTLKTSDN